MSMPGRDEDQVWGQSVSDTINATAGKTRPRRSRLRAMLHALPVAAGLALAGCATTPGPGQQAAASNDPLEPMNRYFFEVHQFFDVFLLKPTAAWYRIIFPDFAQEGIRNALQNLRTPWIMVNDVLQGEGDRAGTSFMRFMLNSTLGVAGLFDVAQGFGYPRHEEDFGQTLGTYGMGEGLFLFIPVIGPTNPRDVVGLVVDSYGDPVNIIARYNDAEWIPLSRSIVTGIDFRAQNLETLDDLERNSVDYYATLRSLYRQRRASEIRNGAPDDDDAPKPE